MSELAPVLSRLEQSMGPQRAEVLQPTHVETLPKKGPPPLEELRVYKEKNAIIKAIQENPVIILKAGTGTGKTRGGSQVCLEAIGQTGKMVVTENLRKATEASSEIVASDMKTTVGELVGFRNKYRHKESEKTRMLFCPVKSLLIMMEKDPLLKETNLVFMDEVHKESKELELCMISLGEIQLKRKAAGLSELKLVFTSATVDDKKLTRHFPGAKTIEIPGDTPHDIDMHFETKEIPVDQLPKAAADKVKHIVDGGNKKNILVFLSGKHEIDEAADYLKNIDLSDKVIIPYYGTLSQAEQEQLFAEHKGKQVIVLATNAAQESLTLKINTVVDTCMHKHKEFDPVTGQEYLIQVKAPRDHLKQRRGRLGRIKPDDGVNDQYYALTTQTDYEGRPEFESAEMQRTDLTPEVLTMLASGHDPYVYQYINTPSRSHIDQAMFRLQKLGAVKKGLLTEKGKFMAGLQIDPHLSSLVFAGMKNGCAKQACELAALLEEYPDILEPKKNKTIAMLSTYKDKNSDLTGMIRIFEQYLHLSGDKTKWLKERGVDPHRMRDTVDLFKELMQVAGGKEGQENETAFNKSIMEGFADRLMKGSGGTYLLPCMTETTFVQLGKESTLFQKNPSAVVSTDIHILKTNKGTIRLGQMNHEIPMELVRQFEKEQAQENTLSRTNSSSPLTNEMPIIAPNATGEEIQQEIEQKPQSWWQKFKSWLKNSWIGKLFS